MLQIIRHHGCVKVLGKGGNDGIGILLSLIPRTGLNPNLDCRVP